MSEPEIIFDPYDIEDGSGTCSFASWDNPELVRLMPLLFHERSGERIVKVLVRPQGLHAVFEYKDTK